MKAMKTIVAVAIIGITLFASSSVVFARGWGRQGGGQDFGPRGQRQGQVMFEEMQEARIQVVAELTKQSTDTVTEKLRNKPVWAVLDEYGAKFTDYQEKMSEKRIDLIKEAVVDGKITQQQADWMIERESQRTKGMARGFGRGRGFKGDCPMF